MKKALFLVLLLLMLLSGAIFFLEDKSSSAIQEPYIAVTSYSLYDITKHIVNDKIIIKKLIPFGVEMHTYMPSVKTMSELSQAKVFIFNGLGVEPWIKKEYPNQLDMSLFVNLDHDEHHEDDGHGHDTEADPHYWLDINNMILMTQKIKTTLSEHFPEHKLSFEENAQTYISELKSIEQEYLKGLKECKHREIVVNHNAFGYLAEAFGFETHSVMGLSPDEQASAKKMKEISDLVKEEGIKVIFFESFVSPAIAETISEETGAQAQALQPLANISKNDKDKSYAELMRENLRQLRAAMECE